MKQCREIDVRIILEFDSEKFAVQNDAAFEAIEMFLDKLPEYYQERTATGSRRLTLHSAEIIRGMVDEDGVPCQRKLKR